MTPEPHINFLDPETQTCPFGAYAQIGRNGGVYIDPSTGFYILTDYSVVKSLTSDNKRLSNQVGLIGTRQEAGQAEIDRIFSEEGVPIRDVLVSSDPPVHSFHRALVDKVFSPVRVARMEAYLREVIDARIDAIIDQGSADFHNTVSLMVPMTVIADQLGLPRSTEDIHRFKIWSDAVAHRSEPQVSHEAQLGYARSICELERFMLGKVEEYRAVPRDCILSDLVHANVDGRTLDIEDLISIAIILIVAGNETTTSAISNGMIRLTSEAELQQMLQADPSRIPAFVEEVLRIDAPLQGLFRRALVDIDVGDVRIPAESTLVLKWGAANRDPCKFAEPDRFDLDRCNVRQHVTFGAGPHFCVGNQLARSELRLTFERVLARMRDVRLSDRPDAVVRQPHYVTYGFQQLWIDFDRLPGRSACN